MGRMYTCEFENVAVTAAQDFFEIVPATDIPVLIHGIIITQSTETGDAAEEMLRVKIIRGATTSGSGGSSVTAAALDSSDAAASLTCEANNTTVATGGSPVDLHSETFNVRTGMTWIPTPEMRPRCDAGDNRIVVNLVAAPADSVTMGATLYLEEI